MRDKRTNANHVRIQFVQKLHVFCPRVRRFKGGANEKATANLKSYVAQGIKTVFAVLETHFLRMKLVIVVFVSGFVTQKVAASTRIIECLILYPAELSC